MRESIVSANVFKNLQEQQETTSGMPMARDRISQAYLGQWGDAATVAKARNRIHWLAEQVEGPRVLDVGTSEGILPILLGREGFEVVGIDINAEAIAHAAALLEQEPEAVRERVAFHNVSLFQHESDAAFDTVVLGEVLEHVNNLGAFLPRVLAHLKEGGRLVVTTPFGLFPDKDHKRSVFLSDVLDLLGAHGRVMQIDVSEGYIRAVVTKTAEPGQDRAEMAPSLLVQTEAAAFDAQKTLWGRLDALQARCDALAAEKRAASERAENAARERDLLRAEAEDLAEEASKQELALTRTRQQLARSEAALDDARQAPPGEEQTALEAEILALEAAAAAREDRIDNLVAELARHDGGQPDDAACAPRESVWPGEAWEAQLNGLRDGGEIAQASLDRACLSLARRVSAQNPLAACAFSAAARAMAPGPRADKAHAFHLLRAGRIDAAATLLNGFDDKTWADLSSGEARQARAVREALRAGEAERAKALATQPQTRSPLRVAAIMDEFTQACFAPECDLLQLLPDHWEAQLAEFEPDLLFIESAWRGRDDAWGGKVGHLSAEVRGILERCREQGVPTAFWNKEDPVHFETFLTTAARFDAVFTTDLDCVGRYKAALGHDNIHLLPFACQPEIHNPVEHFPRKDAFCFAGAYYVRYPHRTRDLESFVEHLPGYRPLEIYDRNFGKDHPDYMFPDSYRPFIVGTLPPEQIDRAYKGYRFGINLNSVKHSQTMFARRVYELLASNTVTVSNYARGLSVMFGDLVITSDNGEEALRRLKAVDADRLRLAGLRKAMREHTYGARFATVAQALGLDAPTPALPPICVVARARSEAQTQAMLAQFRRQQGVSARLALILPDALASAQREEPGVAILSEAEAATLLLSDIAAQGVWVAGMTAEDYYGPHYLLDLALATRYSAAEAIGKAAHRGLEDGRVVIAAEGPVYAPTQDLAYRRAIVSAAGLAETPLRDFVAAIGDGRVEGVEALALDPFNYCAGGAQADGGAQAGVAEAVDDAPDLDCGLSMAALTQIAAALPPERAEKTDEVPQIRGAALLDGVKPPKDGAIDWKAEGDSLALTSRLADSAHAYLYLPVERPAAELAPNGALTVYLDIGPGLNIRFVAIFFDEKGERLGHQIVGANVNHSLVLPEGTTRLRLGLRVYSSGSATVRALLFDRRNPRTVPVIARARTLLLTNHYPSWDDLYRNGFVHARLRAYREAGATLDLFRLRGERDTSYHEFEGVECVTGAPEQLDQMLRDNDYASVLVHFLDPQMWRVLRAHLASGLRVVVWIHGAEIQPWWRRSYNYETDAQLEKAKRDSAARLDFWRGVMTDMPEGLHFVFVSQHFAEEVFEDLEITLDPDRYSVIHNPIDCALFSYEPKPAAQRCNILSIRPYASATYANDLSVAAIELLKDKPFFPELKIRMIGRGPLFDSTLEPLRGVETVEIENRFLRRHEISALHKEFGIFLTPTRMDTQGVSRDEAMASGLVPVTSRVAAVPEFVDETCGFLAEPEDAAGLAAAIEALYHDPARFQAMSRAAAERVRRQSETSLVIEQELRLIHG